MHRRNLRHLLIFIVLVLFVFVSPAHAHHCGDLSDCFPTALAATIVIVGALLLWEFGPILWPILARAIAARAFSAGASAAGRSLIARLAGRAITSLTRLSKLGRLARTSRAPAVIKYPRGIPPKEGARLTQSIRRSLNLPKGEGNVGIAEVNIQGQGRRLLTAPSGRKSLPGTVRTPKDLERLFQTRPSGAIPRKYDSEVKLLEDIAKGLPRDAKGKVSLYTERAPCSRSCQGVIQQFRERFPNIELIITHGS